MELKSIRELIHARGCTPMGEYRCQIPMPINGRLCGIDFCIADIVAALNAANIKTVASCCGHSDESKASIILEDGRKLLIQNHAPNKSTSHPEEKCDDCGGKNVSWHTDSSLWNRVIRSNGEIGDPMLCPKCFALRAEVAGEGGHWIISHG